MYIFRVLQKRLILVVDCWTFKNLAKVTILLLIFLGIVFLQQTEQTLVLGKMMLCKSWPRQEEEILDMHIIPCRLIGYSTGKSKRISKNSCFTGCGWILVLQNVLRSNHILSPRIATLQLSHRDELRISIHGKRQEYLVWDKYPPRWQWMQLLLVQHIFSHLFRIVGPGKVLNLTNAKLSHLRADHYMINLLTIHTPFPNRMLVPS